MRAQGTKHNSPLAVWLNRVGMTSREFQRRLGNKSTAVLSNWLRGEAAPALYLAYEIERITEGGVTMESWLSAKQERAMLKNLRSKQPDEYQPKKAPAYEEDDGEAADE